MKKVTVRNFKIWLQEQVDSAQTPNSVKAFIAKQLAEVEEARRRFGEETEKKFCQKLVDEIWEMDVVIVK